MKKIIILKGKNNVGKTEKIVDLYNNWLVKSNSYSEVFTEPQKGGDIIKIISNGVISIGVNSSGDNRVETEKTEKLKINGCFTDIIVCCCRTKGQTLQYYREKYNYENGWLRTEITVKSHDKKNERDKRDHCILDEIKTWLIGIERK